MAETRTAVVAEDDGNVLALLVRLLQRLGFLAVTTANGVAALEVIALDPPDLVVTNEFMPGMGGEALTRELRARGIATPVVLVSETHDAIDVPGLFCLRKPFRPDAFDAMVAEALAWNGEP